MHRDDLAHMSIDERLDELTSLLAAGFLRLKRRTGCLPSDASPSPDSATFESAESSKSRRNCLAIFRKPWPPVPRVNGQRPGDARR
jgi:hypothetical protein